MRSRSKITYIVIGLIIIGVISQISANPTSYIIPIVIAGVVWFLYKFPPGRGKTNYSKRGTSRPKARTTRSNSNKGKFRVIQGNKKDTFESKLDHDEDPPRYH